MKFIQTDKERLMDICYEKYSQKHIISFDDFFDKIVNDDNFDLEFAKLWEEAKRIDLKRRKVINK